MVHLLLAVLAAALSGPGGEWRERDLPRSLGEEVRPWTALGPLEAGDDSDPDLGPSPFQEPALPGSAAFRDSLEGAFQDPGKAPRDQANPPPAPPPQAEPPKEEDLLHPHHSLGDAVETHFSAKAWRYYVWDDYLTSLEILIPASLAAAAVIIHPWDKQILKKWEGLLGGHQTYSNIGLYTSIGLAVGSGIFFPGEGRNWWDQAWNMGESYGSAALTVYVLKSSVQRPRPGSTPGTGNGTHSFPSGHASGAFGSATLIQRNTGWVAGVPAYALAAFTAFERVEAGRHFPSDIFAGAAIGSLSSGIFDSLHWGSGTEGGIARPPMKLALDMGGLKDFTLSATFGF